MYNTSISKEMDYSIDNFFSSKIITVSNICFFETPWTSSFLIVSIDQSYSWNFVSFYNLSISILFVSLRYK